MGGFRFSELPWFIREEIIYHVVSVGKQYSLVSSEWLKYTAFHFGQCRSNDFEQTKLPSILTQNFGTVWLYNSRIADWNFLNGLKNIKKVIIGSKYMPAPQDGLLSHYVVNANLLTSLSFYCDYSGVFKVERLIKAHHSSLESLAFCNSSLERYDILDEIFFPNLTFFEFTTCDDPFPFNRISTCMPRLKALHINKQGSDRIVLQDHVYENIIELKINLERADSFLTEILDLSSFPSLRRLIVFGDIEYRNPQKCPKLEELTAEEYNPKLYHGLREVFSRLKRLSLIISSTTEDNLFNIILPLCTQLSYLSLEYWYFDDPPSLPNGTFPITSIRIGCSLIDVALLAWLSTCFKLQALQLENYATQLVGDPGNVFFEHLKRVIIRTYNTSRLASVKRHFLSELYPQLDFFEVQDLYR